MRQFATAAALLALAAAPALAQPVPPGANPETGARPGNVIGTGSSLPYSDKASNIDPADTRSLIAPNLPEPPGVTENSSPRHFLQAARYALQNGQTGAGQQALEQAETRLLDRSVRPSRASEPIQGPMINGINSALQALGHHDVGSSIRIIDDLLQRMPPQ
jgi:hypothetical protein